MLSLIALSTSAAGEGLSGVPETLGSVPDAISSEAAT